jgi:hypothetical protein
MWGIKLPGAREGEKMDGGGLAIYACGQMSQCARFKEAPPCICALARLGIDRGTMSSSTQRSSWNKHLKGSEAPPLPTIQHHGYLVLIHVFESDRLLGHVLCRMSNAGTPLLFRSRLHACRNYPCLTGHFTMTALGNDLFSLTIILS